MPVRSLVSWGAMIDGYVVSGGFSEALSLFAECKSLQRFRVSKNHFSGKISSGVWGLPFAVVIDFGDNDFLGEVSSRDRVVYQLDSVGKFLIRFFRLKLWRLCKATKYGILGVKLSRRFIDNKVEGEAMSSGSCWINCHLRMLPPVGVEDDANMKKSKPKSGELNRLLIENKLEENDEDYAKPAAATKINSKKEVCAGSGKRALPDGGILVSECQTNQTSADANPSGNAAGAYGALSNASQTIIAKADGTVTN
ncbi:hypothetical protein IFM89_020067 [Coptis chinensis]|uniref:Uncharacterized protein n=1 Tax=Coptis chinensis TaxID=261450 RepID=A0A835H424_9MAGN|nr:hypothetical protein IFM89_020067 [Coptis chinensis]